MSYVVLAMKLLPTIVQLMVLAEELFTDKPQSGAEKKTLVMRLLEIVMGGTGSVLTGGAAETFERVREPASAIVDAVATIVFPHEPGRIDSMGGGN